MNEINELGELKEKLDNIYKETTQYKHKYYNELKLNNVLIYLEEFRRNLLIAKVNAQFLLERLQKSK